MFHNINMGSCSHTPHVILLCFSPTEWRLTWHRKLFIRYVFLFFPVVFPSFPVYIFLCAFLIHDSFWWSDELVTWLGHQLKNFGNLYWIYGENFWYCVLLETDKEWKDPGKLRLLKSLLENLNYYLFSNFPN